MLEMLRSLPKEEGERNTARTPAMEYLLALFMLQPAEALKIPNLIKGMEPDAASPMLGALSAASTSQSLQALSQVTRDHSLSKDVRMDAIAALGVAPEPNKPGVDTQVWGTTLYATFNPAPLNWNRTFFSANKTFWVGPVPVNVKLNVSGGASLAVNGEIGPTVARLNVQPGAFANLTGSASASVIVAGVGVDVSMKLVDARLPSYGELFWPYCTLDWKLQSNLVLTNTLGGKVSAWAKVSLLFFKKTWRVTIAEWAGINRNWTLLNIYGSKVLGLC